MTFKRWFDENFSQIREDYFRFLRFASVSTDESYRPHVMACADFLADYLKKHGFHAEQIPTIGYPIVYAEDCSAGPAAPTILIYGHYDVQPVDPIESWVSPPFEPTERDGKIYARGAVDDKGQIFYACLAAIAWKATRNTLPVNLKFCIEGEEESHSMGLSSALPKLKDRFNADELLIVDFDSASDGTPSVTLGARGCIALEVTLTGSNQDLHSGQMGGIAYNPNRALVQLLAKLWDQNGTVTVPGFYDGVENPSPADLKNYTFSMTEEELKKDFGIVAFANEKGRNLQESNWFRPTLEINGIFGGYSGKGSKTVIPAIATAKITCRLVVNQDALKIGDAIEKFLRQHAPKGMDVQVLQQGGIGAYRSSMNTPLSRAVAKAASDVSGKKSAYVLSGASIPIGAEFVRIMNIPVVGTGYGLSTDRIHAPNEHFDWKRFEKGFLTIARIFSYYEMDR
ncbi:MAG TPA: dipeptidase [Chlamydiales bacterium]|nr:dipeptidase [Chlamydiales bacterium]